MAELVQSADHVRAINLANSGQLARPAKKVTNRAVLTLVECPNKGAEQRKGREGKERKGEVEKKGLQTCPKTQLIGPFPLSTLYQLQLCLHIYEYTRGRGRLQRLRGVAAAVTAHSNKFAA